MIVLDADGDVVQVLGEAGSGNGQLNQPRGVALDPSDGDVAIADFGNDRVSVWKQDAGATCPTPQPRPTRPRWARADRPCCATD